jgi:hypothetical protein
MLGWLFPQCPLDLEQKVWTEYRMHWLADRLGIDRMLKAVVVTPTSAFFPDEFTGTPSEVVDLMVRLAKFMGVSPLPELEILPEILEATGLYFNGPPALIQIDVAILDNPKQLAATLMHELAHAIQLPFAPAFRSREQ